MPPKKDSGASKKTVEKIKNKVIDDKTFGLKNKNKSVKVQTFIKTVSQQVKGLNKGGEAKMLELEYKAKEEKKKSEQEKALLASLFKSAITIKKEAEDAQAELDKKTVPCAFYKAGVCHKGKNCKFSHDLEESESRVAKIDLYTDPREAKDDGNLKGVKSDIVCNFFLDAVEKKIYGWGWECPNGDECQYRHALPPGYVLESDKKLLKELGDDDDVLTFEEEIELARSKLPSTGLTAVTISTFNDWKKRKEKKKEQQEEAARKAEAKKTGNRGIGVLSGRALFKFDPKLFVDDDEAFEEEFYEEEVKKPLVNGQGEEIKEELKEDDEEEEKEVAFKDWNNPKQMQEEDELEREVKKAKKAGFDGIETKKANDKEEEKDNAKNMKIGNVDVDADLFSGENLDDIDDLD